MCRFNFILAFILTAAFIKAQVVPDSKLYVKYEQEYINNFLAKNPEIVDYLNFFVNHCYKIIDKQDKEISCTELQKIDAKTGQKTAHQITM
ncbi:MAG: hypothetical protein HY738_22935, partial [Bacteroidia bacterium]|nr:hypothetical protein [Bacteroidia bacterium]